MASAPQTPTKSTETDRYKDRKRERETVSSWGREGGTEKAKVKKKEGVLIEVERR